MIAYLFGLLSTFAFGISNTYWKKASAQVSFPGLVFFRGIIACSCFGIAWIYFRSSNKLPDSLINEHATFNQYGLTILLCLICSLGLVFYLKSLDYSPVSISVPLSSINIFGILAAVIILKEHFKPIYFFSFGIGIIGVLLSQSYTMVGKKYVWNKGGNYSILAALFWGSSYTLFKYSSQWMGAIPLAFILEGSVVFTALIWLRLSDPNFFQMKYIFSSGNIKHYFILALFLLCGTLFFNLAVQNIPLLVINIFGFFTLFVSISTGIIFYKERLSVKQGLGVCCLLISILIVQLYTN